MFRYIMDNPLCYYSSLLFVVNVVVCIYHEYYLYSVCFVLLTITSLYYHSRYTPFSGVIDKIALYIVICYGGYLFYNKIDNESLTGMKLFLNVIIVLSFLSTIVLYYNVICCCEDTLIANCYHALMHCISSIGHVCIAIV